MSILSYCTRNAPKLSGEILHRYFSSKLPKMIRTVVWRKTQYYSRLRLLPTLHIPNQTTVTSNFCSTKVFSTKSIWNTETKSSQILTTLKSLTKMLNHLDHIIWQINCANLWLFGRQIQDFAVPIETRKFSERSPIIFCRFSQRKV